MRATLALNGLNVLFALFKFPSVFEKYGKKEEWIRQFKRENKNKTPWKPYDSDRVYSKHFIQKQSSGGVL